MKASRKMWEGTPSPKPGLWQIMNREDLWSDRVADPLSGTCNACSVALSHSLLISKITFCPLFGGVWQGLTPPPPTPPKQDVPSCWLSTPEWVLFVGRIEQTPSEGLYFLRTQNSRDSFRKTQSSCAVDLRGVGARLSFAAHCQGRFSLPDCPINQPPAGRRKPLCPCHNKWLPRLQYQRNVGLFTAHHHPYLTKKVLADAGVVLNEKDRSHYDGAVDNTVDFFVLKGFGGWWTYVTLKKVGCLSAHKMYLCFLSRATNLMAPWSLSAQKQWVTLPYSSKFYLWTIHRSFFFERPPGCVYTFMNVKAERADG